MHIAKSTYSDIKVHKLGIKAYEKRCIPKYVKDQKIRAKRGCRIIYRQNLLSSKTKVLLKDDETFMFLQNK